MSGIPLHTTTTPTRIRKRRGGRTKKNGAGLRLLREQSGIIRFCVTWYKVFVVLGALYAGTVVYIYIKISSSDDNETSNHDGGGGVGDHQSSIGGVRGGGGGGIVSPMKAAIQRVNSKIVDSIIHNKNKKVEVGVGLDQQQLQERKFSPVAVRNLHDDDDHVQRIKRIESMLKMRSCRRRNNNDGGNKEDSTFLSLDASCSVGENGITYHNPHPTRPRYVCGKRLDPESSVEMPIPCSEPPRLYLTIPDRTGKGVPAVTTRFGDPKREKTATEFKDCDIPCKHAGRPTLNCVRTVDGTPFEIRFSMEGPQYYKSLYIDADGYQNHKYWSTTSYRSEIPLPYFSWSEYKIQTPAVQYDTAIKGAVFMARNCNSRNNREKLVKFLRDSGTLRVDSVSTCLHNAEVPEGTNRQNKNEVLGKYLLYLAFENQNEDDYITEKLWGSFESGVLPVYFGSPNVKEHIPDKAVINVLDFDSNEKLLEYLVKVVNDKELYESHQAWRSKPLPENFHAKYDFTEVHSTCRTCRWAYAKIHGLGWNHNNQSLRELNVPRNVCLDDSGKIVRPFVESWDASSSRGSDPLRHVEPTRSSCGVVDSRNRILHVDDGKIKRTVWEQDGVIDIMIETPESHLPEYKFWMKTQLKGDFEMTLETVGDGHYRLQDDQSRYTFLLLPRKGAPAVTHHGAKDGDKTAVVVMIIRPEDGLPIRMRIIVEDLDKFHKDADQMENYFAQQMMEDFYSPVEGFVRE